MEHICSVKGVPQAFWYNSEQSWSVTLLLQHYGPAFISRGAELLLQSRTALSAQSADVANVKLQIPMTATMNAVWCVVTRVR